MSPFGPLDNKEEQSEEERLAIARRYRESRGRELRAIAEPELPRAPREVGEFSTLPIESLAAIPVLGALFAGWTRATRSRRRTTPNVLVAVDAEQAHLLAVRGEVEGTRAKLVQSWPLEQVRVVAVTPRFMREEVLVETPEAEPLKLYARSLRSNPWAAAVVRALGGEAPEPRDLSAPAPAD
jgi:hypothetical protein